MSFFGYRAAAARPSQQETHLSELERLYVRLLVHFARSRRPSALATSDSRRGRQLASLVRAGGRAKNQQQTTFEVAVAETPRGPLALVITLPFDFPVKAPQVKASTPLQHALLDASGIVQGHADLNHWTAHSDLGRIVSEIANDLRRATSNGQLNQPPPPVSPVGSTSSAASSSSNFRSSASRYASPGVNPPQTPPHQPPPAPVHKLQRSQVPTIPAVFPTLEELSLAQLENLAQDKRALKTFAKNLDPAKDFCKLRDDVMSNNMKTAQKTLEYELVLRGLQTEVEQLRAELREAQQALAAKQARQQRVISRHRPDALLDQLSSATKESDATSDEFAHQFVHGEMDVTQFLAQYLPERSRYHERTIRLTRVLQH